MVALQYWQSIICTGDIFSSSRSMNPCPCAPQNDSTCPLTGSDDAGEHFPQFSCIPGFVPSAGNQDEAPAHSPPQLPATGQAHCFCFSPATTCTHGYVTEILHKDFPGQIAGIIKMTAEDYPDNDLKNNY